MKNKGYLSVILVTCVLSIVSIKAFAQYHDRSEIPVEYTWNLSDIFASDADWYQAKKDVQSDINKITEYKGQLNNPDKLLECLQLKENIGIKLNSLYLYASANYDADTRNITYQTMDEEINQVYAEYASANSFVNPEILKIDDNELLKLISERKDFGNYDMYIKDLIRQKEHILSEAEEKIIAYAAPLTNSPYTVYSHFYNAEFPFAQFITPEGDTVILRPAAYTNLRNSDDREVREKVFKLFFGRLGDYNGTLGNMLNSQIKADIFYSKTRGFQSSLGYALSANNIPVDVYNGLISNVNNNLETFHRYLKLKKRMLGVDTLKYCDIYAPTVKGIDLNYEIEEAKKMVLKSLEPLGQEYVKVVDGGFNNRWIDFYPNDGKRSGAYSNDAYGVHPYILMNYTGDYDEVRTLAHELGHSMHSYFSNKNNNFMKANYSIFVAEIASTFNEALLFDYMIKNVKNDEIRLSLLMNYLDGIKGTLFRQTQFAEFELKIHELAEAGVALNGEVFTKVYTEILNKYYGYDENICKVSKTDFYEWAYIPHFYYTFYVYQYATSFTASQALASDVLANKPDAKEKYMAFLSAGGSDYPINIIKKAGLDMTTSEPFDKTIQKMNEVIDEIESILDKKASKK